MANSEDTGGPPDTEQLYDLCETAAKSLEKIATGLGQIGADPAAVKAVSQMADVVQKICNGLAKGMKSEPAEQPHTIGSATDDMMADRAGPPA